MTDKDSIISLPAAPLRRPSQKVGIVTNEIRQIITQMRAATLDWEDSRKHELGVALAAVQINRAYRIIIIREDFEERANRRFQVFINPEITKLEGEVVEDFEGCLSIKNIYGKVPRHSKVRIKAWDEDGHEVRLKAEGFLARIFQHEIDHTKGKVFIDHIKDNPDAFYKLDQRGKLNKLNYEKDIKDSPLLWQ